MYISNALPSDQAIKACLPLVFTHSLLEINLTLLVSDKRIFWITGIL
jgi:hypothetical protein